jgi:tetratricopeptide (TPR) repeat protein
MRASQLPVPPGPSSEAPTSARASTSGSLKAPAAHRLKEAPPLPPDPPASGLAPDQLAFWKEVIERTRAIDTQTYFDMLGVPRDAGSDTIRKAYFALAKRWHPDRISGALLPIKPFVERIFGHITHAQDTLADENKRAGYIRSVQDGGGTPEADRKLGAIVTAAMEVQKAEVLVRRRDFVGARSILEAAIELNAEEADALASLAWVIFNLPNEKTSAMLDLADRSIRIAPKHDRAHYTRGMILRRMGNEAEAVLAFRAAAAANPKNIDAVREVRLADMRAGQAPTAGAKQSMQGVRPGAAKPEGEAAPAAEGGFLSKLFGSPKKK